MKKEVGPETQKYQAEPNTLSLVPKLFPLNYCASCRAVMEATPPKGRGSSAFVCKAECADSYIHSTAQSSSSLNPLLCSLSVQISRPLCFLLNVLVITKTHSRDRVNSALTKCPRVSAYRHRKCPGLAGP